MARLWILAAALLAAPAAAAQDGKEEKKAQEEAAKEKIKVFREAVKASKSESDIVTALEELGSLQHEKVLAELGGFLYRGNGEVKREAARQIAKYKKDVKAADHLLKAVPKEKESDTAVKFLGCVGDIGAKETARSLHGFFKHKELDIAGAGVGACGAIKSKDSIPPLIMLVKELEAVRDDPNAPGGPPLPGPGAGPAGGEDENLKRKRQLLPTALQALKDITGERYNKGDDWEKWWAKAKAKFKEQD